MAPVERLNRVASSGGPVPWKGVCYLFVMALVASAAVSAGRPAFAVLTGLVLLAGAAALAVRTLRLSVEKAGE